MVPKATAGSGGSSADHKLSIQKQKDMMSAMLKQDDLSMSKLTGLHLRAYESKSRTT